MTAPRRPISPERARMMLAQVRMKLNRPELPDDKRTTLEEMERLLQAKLRFYETEPEKGQHVHDWLLGLFHLRRSLGLPEEYPAAATLALAQTHAGADDVDGDSEGGNTEDPERG